MNNKKHLSVTLMKSKYGRSKDHIACVHGLGLHKIHQTVVIEDNPTNRGLINKIAYLLKVEEMSS